MKLKIFLFLFVLVFPAVAAPQKKESFVGYKHKGVKYGETLPNGAKDLGGGLLSNDNFGVTRYTKGKKYMLWLERITARDREGVPSWEVKDVLTFDPLKKNQEFSFSYSSGCVHNGRENLDLIVLTEASKDKKTYKAIKAWRVNLTKAKFEKISTKGIECREVTAERYG